MLIRLAKQKEALETLLENSDAYVGSIQSLAISDATAQDVIDQLQKFNDTISDEIVFCGYGEPTSRLNELIASAKHLKSIENCPPLRLNTNGLSDLINERETANEIGELFDVVSVSLNAGTENEYMRVTRPKYSNAFEAMQKFAVDCSKTSANVMMSVVDVIPEEEIEAAKRLCDNINVKLRIRKYES